MRKSRNNPSADATPHFPTATRKLTANPPLVREFFCFPPPHPKIEQRIETGLFPAGWYNKGMFPGKTFSGKSLPRTPFKKLPSEKDEQSLCKSGALRCRAADKIIFHERFTHTMSSFIRPKVFEKGVGEKLFAKSFSPEIPLPHTSKSQEVQKQCSGEN